MYWVPATVTRNLPKWRSDQFERITASTTEGASVGTTVRDPHHNQISSADRSREPSAHPVHCLLMCHLISQAVCGVITQERVSVRRFTRATKSWKFGGNSYSLCPMETKVTTL